MIYIAVGIYGTIQFQIPHPTPHSQPPSPCTLTVSADDKCVWVWVGVSVRVCVCVCVCVCVNPRGEQVIYIAGGIYGNILSCLFAPQVLPPSPDFFFLSVTLEPRVERYNVYEP